MLCSIGKDENEFHFLLECPFYENLRNKYVHQYSNGKKITFTMLLSSTDAAVINKLACYIHFAFKAA